ncbi:YciI family protein [Actinopolymorpha alba]|uniref:YciI family protein n=1 Tax=Actinopolymorpha alba TaxID=533267 RepID=UPI00036DBB32|nr:YciI family protein [Actinopolymorpha alba]
MKYLILIYGNVENWQHPIFERHPAFLAMPPEERAELTRQAEAMYGEITESGELIAGVALADPVKTRTVRVRGGVPTVTDGPYAEAKEQLAGYFVVDCESPDRAAEIAARFPDARLTAVEVRPIMNMSVPEA